MANSSLGYVQYMIFSTEQIPGQLRRTRKLLTSQGSLDEWGPLQPLLLHESEALSEMGFRGRFLQKSEIPASSSRSLPGEQLLGDTSPLLGEFSNTASSIGKQGITNKKQKVTNKWSQNSRKFYAWWMPVYMQIPSLCMLTDQKTLIITGGGESIYKFYNQITSGLCTF